MPSVVHVVTTSNFAGVERYVSTTASETAARGWEVAVVGGQPEQMPLALDPGVRWLPGATAAQALRSLAHLGRRDICHAHMTLAEAVGVACRPIHAAPVVSTRHFAQVRGSSRSGRALAPWITAGLSRQIAVSNFVAQRLERPPDAVVPNGVPPARAVWSEASRVVLVLQRLEREKDTLTALRAWRASRLADEGWSLRVVGSGSLRTMLEAWVRKERVAAVVFTGWLPSVVDELAGAGMLLASAPAEPFGLAVVEAMAAGVPVVSTAAGAHLETAGRLADAAMFQAGDADGAAEILRSLLAAEARVRLSRAGRSLVEESFTLAGHVDRLLLEYAAARRPFVQRGRLHRQTRKQPLRRSPGREPDVELRELVVCSLEAWDDIWRRNQFFTQLLLQRNPALRVLFVEPPADPLFDLACRRGPALPRLRRLSADGRLRAFRPLKPFPRRVGLLADGLLRRQVLAAARLNGFSHPMLWLNDVTYAPLAASWRTLYDVTDDWLLAPFSPRELERLRRLDALALALADEVVVCSTVLGKSRGEGRTVTVVRNGVEVEHFRRPRARPPDLPASPVAVYVGTLHESRLDVELVVATARALPHVRLALVGPDSLSHESREQFRPLENVALLGPKPYDDVPAYLQHADVLIVPHLVSPFTESLDPIKAYECLAVDTPTVATPVAGFRDQPLAFSIIEAEGFPQRVANLVAQTRPATRPVASPAGWEERVVDFEDALRRALMPDRRSRAARARRRPPSR